LGTKYLVVLCAGSTLPLAKQSLDEAPYKLSRAVAKLAGITFSRLSLSYWIDNLGFKTEGKLAAIFIKTFSWGFPTGRSFLLHQQTSTRPHQVFWRRCRGGRRLLQGEFLHVHPLLCFKFCFYFIFTCIVLSKTPKN
jgi:hypothetical protein